MKRGGHSWRAALPVVDALVILLATIWGVNMVIVKQTLAELAPLSFNSLRFLCASVVLLGCLPLLGENWSVQRRDWPRIAVLAAVGITLYQVCFAFGINLSTATNVSLALNTAPGMVIVLGALLGLERPPALTWAGVALAFCGLVLVIGGKEQGIDLSGQTVRGDLLALCSAATWAVYTVLAKPLFARYSPIKLTAVVIAVGTVLLTVVSVPSLASQDWGRVTLAGWAGLAYSSALAIALGYVIFYTGVKHLGGARTTSYINLSPVITMGVAALVLGERMSGIQMVGAAIVLIGIYLARRNGS